MKKKHAFSFWVPPKFRRKFEKLIPDFIYTFLWSRLGFLLFTIAEKTRNNMSGGYGKKFEDHILFKNKIIKNLFFKYIYPPMPTFNSIERKSLRIFKVKFLEKKESFEFWVWYFNW